MKRTISIILVLAMLFAAGIPAFAAEEEKQEEYPFAVVEFADGLLGSYSESGMLLSQAEGVISVFGSGFENPTGLAVDGEGNLYLSETDRDRILKITHEGKSSVYQKDLLEPMGLCWADGKLFVAETGKNRIVCIDGDCIKPVAGKAIASGLDEYEGANVNGRIEDVLFDHPQGVCVLEDGTVFVADTGNHAVKMIKDGKCYPVLTNPDLSGEMIKPAHMWVEDGVLRINDMFSESITDYKLDKRGFNDVAEGTDWFADYVNEAVLMGIVDGIGGNKFAPRNNVSRSQLACMISRLASYKDGALVAKRLFNQHKF